MKLNVSGVNQKINRVFLNKYRLRKCIRLRPKSHPKLGGDVECQQARTASSIILNTSILNSV